MRSLFLAAVAALCFLTISVCPAVTSAVVEDLNGPLGPDDEQLGVGGDDDAPSNTFETQPSNVVTDHDPDPATAGPEQTRQTVLEASRYNLLHRILRRLRWATQWAR